jgi:hypothetical protein
MLRRIFLNRNLKNIPYTLHVADHHILFDIQRKSLSSTIHYSMVMRLSRNFRRPIVIALEDELKSGSAIVLEISPKYFST